MTRNELAALLALPRRGPTPKAVRRDVEERDVFVIEQLSLDFGGMIPVRGILTWPARMAGRRPAVLYCHAHGGAYEIGASELLDGRKSLISPYGPLLAQQGFVTLAIDMPTFGERRKPREDSLAKALLWHGRTLMGAMLGDLLAAFAYLLVRDDVDPWKIATMGLSMGATHAYFLGALEPRLNRVAHLCCFADWEYLIRTEAHDLHGHYMTIPGLLAQTSVGAIAGMTAPRPQLICVGHRDPLTPRPAIDLAFEETRAVYRQMGADRELILVGEPDAGHAETPRMREAVLDFLGEMKR